MTPETIRQGAGWIVRFGRLGYAVKGLLYIIVGALATEAALGIGGGTTDTRGALRAVAKAPFGHIALIVVAAGLVGYAVWRVVSAIVDGERRGSEPTSVALRIGEALRGIVYGALGASAIGYLTGNHGDTGDRTRSLTSRALSFPAGRWIVIAAGLILIGYALYQVYRAISRKFLKRLDLSTAGELTRSLIERLGGFGIAARAVVFAMIGILIVRAGWNYDPAKAGGIEKSLDMIAGHEIIFVVVAVGLIAFGILQIATARYRVMRAT